MLDAVNIAQATGGAANVAARAAVVVPRQPAPEKAAAKPAPVQVEAAVEQAPPLEQQPISPRIRPDFLAGTVVTEFSGSNGEITQQVPTQAVLAYLRAGLTATGENEPNQVEEFISANRESVA